MSILASVPSNILRAIVWNIEFQLEEVAHDPDSKLHCDGICVDIKTAICQNVIRLREYREHFNTVQRLFTLWPEYSGNPEYPVPCPIEFAPQTPENAKAVFVARPFINMWTPKTEYGRSRIRLAAFIIEEIQKELKNRENKC